MQLSIFTAPDQPFPHRPKPELGEFPVVTASRRTDLVGWYRDYLIKVLREKYPPARTHTLVPVTKFAGALLKEPLRPVLESYESLFVHLTCTGMGGTEFEPLAPAVEETFRVLPELLAFLKDPRRLRFRVDPIIHVQKGRQTYTNLPLAEEIIQRAVEAGAKDFSTSFMTIYPKTVRQFGASGWEPVELMAGEKQEIFARLRRLTDSLGARLFACCTEGLPESRCIDAFLLTELHPRRIPCSGFEPRSRAYCACHHSVDIGGFYNQPCKTGCRYCYARPQLTYGGAGFPA
ncbi:MAG: DUF1848 domain-containing protein [Firmicutes bacterium]|nr:DUF1848 domain-containing protein [Bacillota bacterium]